MKTGRLITASATTGWGDWIHGELWLFPDGLLRVRAGLLTTLGNGIVRTVSAPLPTRAFTDDEIGRLASAHRTNCWIASSSISSASIRRGLLASRLSLELTDRSQLKLFWLRHDPAEPQLRAALTGWGFDL
jgi:hypothetical protein